MRKNFTQLISGLTQSKKYVIALTSLMILAGSVYLYAEILGITPQNVIVSADRAVGGPDASFTQLGPIVLQEGNQKDFATGTNGNLILAAPEGWVFRQSGVTPVVTGGGNPSNISIGAIVYTPSSISIPFSVSGENRVDRISIEGVALQAQTGAVLASRSVMLSISGAAVAGYTSPITVANISQTHGAARKLAFEQQPSITDIYAPIAPMTVLIQDWAGNTVTNANNTVSLAIGNNPGLGLGALTSGSATRTNGVVTFSGYSINASGTGYTLTASSSTLTPATSSAFNITSTTPILESIDATCITIGSGPIEIILRGSNFARNAVGRIGTNSAGIRTTTFVSTSELRMTLTAEDLATAGAKNIYVVNPAPANGTNVSSSQALVVNHTIATASITNAPSLTATDPLSLCTGTNRTFTAPANFTDYAWEILTDGAVMTSATATANAFSIRFDNEVPASGIVRFRVAATNPCNVRTSRTFEIELRQAPIVNVTHDTPLIFCEGGSVVLRTIEDPSYKYQWQLGRANIDGATSSSFTATEVGNYRVVVTADNLCAVTSVEFGVSYTLPLTQGGITGNTNYCQGSPATALSATVDGGFAPNGTTVRARTYIWEKRTSENGSWQIVQGPSTASSAANYTPSTTEAGTAYYRRRVLAGGCESSTTAIAVTVTPEITNNTISGAQTVCSGSPIALLDGEQATAGSESIEYLWEQSATGANGSWEPAEGTNNQEDYQPATRTVDATSSIHYQRRVKAGECTTYSNKVIVKVTAMPVATITQGTNTYFCPPGTAVLSAQSFTGYTYKWYRVVDGEDDVEVGTTRTINVGRVGEESAIDKYYVVATQVTDGNSCSTQSAPITVQETVVGNNIVTSDNLTVCYNEKPAVIVGSEATSTLGNVTYQWQSSLTENGNYTAVTEVVNTNTNLALGPQTTDRWYRRSATVGSCSVVSEPIAVFVKDQIANTLTSGNQTICLNNPAQAITGNPVTGGDGPTSYTYTWYQRTGTGDWEAASGINNQENYTPEVSATAGTYSFRRDVVSGNCLPIASNIVTVTVQPAIVGNIIGGTNTYCLNTTATDLATEGAGLSGGAGSGYTYSWQERVGENGTWTTITGATSYTYRPLTTTAGDFYYKRIVNSGACTGAESNEFKVTVLPAIVNTLSGPDSYSYCQNTTATEISGNVGGGDGANYTYQWQRRTSTTGSWSAAPGTNNEASYTPVITTSGTSYYRRTVTSGVCAAFPSNVIAVTVIPAIASNTLGGASSVCFNSQPALVTGSLPTNGNGDYTYLWEQSIDGGATWVAAVGTNSEQNYQPPVLTVTTQYRRTVNAGTCLPNVSAPRTVTVNPLPAKPVISNLTKSVYYSGETAFNLSVSHTHTSGRFIYERRNDATGDFTEVSRVQSASFSPCSLAPGTYRISYTYTSGGCSNTSDPITFTIRRSNYTVVIEAAPFPTCRGQNTTYRAVVYRDVQSILYPYLTNAQGQPIDQNGNILAAKAYPIPNPAYPFPADAPQILKDNAYRYYQPIVTGGIRVNDGNKENDFTYRWTKNFDNYPFGNTAQAGNAGLSSEDYYAVSVYANPSISGNSCIDAIPQSSPLWSNRTYTAAPINYEVKLETDKATICEGGSITMSANLDAAFAFWKDIELTLYWMVERPGVTNPIELGSTKYTTGNQVSFTTTGPNGTFQNGDKVFVEFSSVIDKQNDVNSKCSRGFTTNQVAITVVGTQTMSGGGAYCAGSAGIPVGINGSQQGVLYQLLLDGQPVGDLVAGTGSALSFGNQTIGGAYSVQALSAAGETPCLTYEPVNVVVTPLPAAQSLSAGNNGEYCINGTGVPITLGSSETGVQYQLRRTVGESTVLVGAPLPGTGQALEFGLQKEAGEYTVLATTVAQNGTVASCAVPMGSATVIINPLPTITVNSPSTCAGTPVQVTATPVVGTAPFTYNWEVPAGWTGPKPTTASFSTTVPGNYTVSITDSKSCTVSQPVTSTVTVMELPEVTVSSATICANQTATVSASASKGSGNYRYEWIGPAGFANPGDVVSFTTNMAGVYQVRVTDNAGCESAAVTGSVTVMPMIEAEGIITAANEHGPITPSNPIGANEKVTFTATAPIPAADIVGYVWFKGDRVANTWTQVHSGISNQYEMTPASVDAFDLRAQILTADGTCYDPIYAYTDEPITPLPVELLYFNATKRGSDAVLDWATASEQDNKGFEVQVSSDARNFRALGFVESRVNTTSLKQVYTFVDKENGKHGTRYYRLKQVDLDGKFEYFIIKAVSFGSVEANKVKAYPNPFQSEVELSIDAELDGDLLITVTNATGQQLLQRTVQVARGTNTEKLVLDPNLPRGVYIISTRMGDFNSHFKLLKQ